MALYRLPEKIKIGIPVATLFSNPTKVGIMVLRWV